VSDLGPLYHWSPRNRLARIKRLGLLPGQQNDMGPVFHHEGLSPDFPGYDDVVAAGEFRQDKLCFSLDPATAWNYSHGAWDNFGTFDLWQLWLEDTDEVHVLPAWGARIVEVRVANPIPYKRLHLVGERNVLHPAALVSRGMAIPRGYPRGLARQARALKAERRAIIEARAAKEAADA
jgi:hypothetical protein